jgi:hypothetical protein
VSQGEFDFGRRERTIDACFRAFHAENPQVYATLVRLSREATVRGRTRIGVGMLWEVMRWEMWLASSKDDEGWKLNNNFRSRYARMIMEREQDLADVFEIRELRSL